MIRLALCTIVALLVGAFGVLICVTIQYILDESGASTWIRDMLWAPFRGIGKFFAGLKDFTSMFYQENCPHITIISEEESILE